MEFFAPLIYNKRWNIKISHPDVPIFSGATDLGVQFNKRQKIRHRL